MRTLAFYLPQYHPIKENNEWWGNGFTEWTNVSKSRPLFNGHYQPHIPADLGFYDLRLSETRVAQAKLAQQYGIDGFCYYHYWFNGQMLLDRPFNEVLSSRESDLPFCLCWANENWTRRWDGKEASILMAQQYDTYSPSEHIQWLAPAFADDRYIKIDGKPLFLIYKASEIHNLKSVIASWREEIKKMGFEDLHLCCADNSKQTMSKDQYFEAGFDSIYEFTPDFSEMQRAAMHSNVPGLGIYDYSKIVEMEIQKLPETEHLVYPCVFPSWDNTARRKTNGTVIQNDDEKLYMKWLNHSMERVSHYKSSEQIVFINAWNEWGEGCHLEPDLRNGNKFLEATKQVTGGSYEREDLNASFDKIPSKEEELLSLEEEKPIIYYNSSRPLYLWGAGSYGLDIYKMLKRNGLSVKGFIDSNPARQGEVIDGISIISPEAINSLRDGKHDPFVIVCSMYFDEIGSQLDEQGFSRNSDYSLGLLNMSVSKEYEGLKEFILLEQGLIEICNVCGFNQFSPSEISGSPTYRCDSCGSTSRDRMMIEILSEEIGTGGAPLAKWASMSNVRILNLEAINKEVIHYFDLLFENLDVDKRDLNKVSGKKYHFIFMAADRDDICPDELLPLLRNHSKVIIILDKPEMFDAVRKQFTDSGCRVYSVQRNYKRCKTGLQTVLLCEKIQNPGKEVLQK